MSKEKTMEETREELLSHVWNMTRYWNELPDKSTKDRLEGLAFSILVALDGCSGGLPGFIVAPIGTKEDKVYCIENDEDFYSINEDCDIKCDIAGGLHELFNSVGKKLNFTE